MTSSERREQERAALAANSQTAPYAAWYDTSEAAEALGFTEMHTKSLIRNNKLRAVKVAFKGYKKWLVDPESVEGYEAKAFGPTGMRRYILRIDPEHVDIEDIKEYLSETYGDEGIDPNTGEVIWTLAKPKQSKSTKKRQAEAEDFTPQILARYGNGGPPEPSEPTQVPSGDSEDDEDD